MAPWTSIVTIVTCFPAAKAAIDHVETLMVAVTTFDGSDAEHTPDEFNDIFFGPFGGVHTIMACFFLQWLRVCADEWTAG